jgi:predicted metalloendopeptidase
MGEAGNVNRTVRTLLAEVLEDGETGMYISRNQPQSKDFRIQCRCGGISNPSTVFFDRKEHEKALSEWDEDAREFMGMFLIYMCCLEGEVTLTGICTDCSRVLVAHAQFLLD